MPWWKPWPKAGWKEESLFGINSISHNPLGKANAGIQSWNLDVGIEAEIIEECYLLGCSSWLIQQFLNNPELHFQWWNWHIVGCLFPCQLLNKTVPSMICLPTIWWREFPNRESPSSQIFLSACQVDKNHSSGDWKGTSEECNKGVAAERC